MQKTKKTKRRNYWHAGQNHVQKVTLILGLTLSQPSQQVVTLEDIKGRSEGEHVGVPEILPSRSPFVEKLTDIKKKMPNENKRHCVTTC